MVDPRRALALFLRTDLRRLEAALDGQPWSDADRERVAQHLQLMAQAQAALLDAEPPRVPTMVRLTLAHAPQSSDAALAALADGTEALLEAVARASDARLRAEPLDPHERGLSVVEHLWDFARASAMLVEWARGLPPPEPTDVAAWLGM